MLLPSALPCDTRPRPPLQRLSLFTTTTPPSSPPSPHFSTNIVNTCRTLHSYLGIQPTRKPASTNPPRLGSSFTHSRNTHTKVEKRRAVPRGMNKRRRNTYEEDSAKDQENLHAMQKDESYETPSTPKRQRVAPPSIPLGLQRKDFYALQPVPQRGAIHTSRTTFTNPSTSTFASHDTQFTFSPTQPSTPPPIHTEPTPTLSPSLTTSTQEDDEWTTDDDTALVELVLEKLRFSRREWAEVATVLGTDGASIGRRWKELVGDGEVGLRFRRGKGRKGGARGDVRGVFDVDMNMGDA